MNSNRSNQVNKAGQQNNARSVSQLDTLETVSIPSCCLTKLSFSIQSQIGKNDQAIVMGGKHVAENGGMAAKTLQFGFTTAAMKTTLFSRMSPSAAKNGNGSFAETTKMRTQGSQSNMGPTNGGTTNNAGSSLTSPTNARTISMPTSGANARIMKSPFRDAMQKGVLSGAGLLTH